MARIRDILAWLDEYAPFRFSASWDRCGLQVGAPDAEVCRALVALDPGTASLSEAGKLECGCLVTHHPLLFQPLDCVRFDTYPGKLLVEAIRREIHLIAVHTNLDAALGGTNDRLAALLELRDVEPLEVESAYRGEDRYLGMGLVGDLERRTSLNRLVENVRKALGGIEIKVVGDGDSAVRRMAVCSGSGGSLIDTVIAGGVDVYLTGDVKYHEAQRAVEAGLAVIDVGHFASEKVVVGPLAEYLQSRADSEGADLKVFAASEERDPFWIYGKGAKR